MDLIESAYNYWCYVYLPQAPAAPLWLLGLVLAFLFRRQRPRLSLTASVAFIVFLGVSLGNTILQTMIQQGKVVDVDAARNVAEIATLLGWLLLLAAVFGWRTGDTRATPPPDLRPISRAAFAGALVGGVLMIGLRLQAPFFLALFETTGRMIEVGSGLGALVGATAAATHGSARGAILGAAAGVATVHLWAAAGEPEAAGRPLSLGPYALLFGALLGAAVGWAWRTHRR